MLQAVHRYSIPGAAAQAGVPVLQAVHRYAIPSAGHRQECLCAPLFIRN